MIEQRKTQIPRIVILGAGFGGLYTFLQIRKLLSPQQAEITIINRTNYFLFTPLLHEVATGSLAHHQVVEAIRSITYKRGANLHVAEVVRINTKQKEVETSVAVVPYDVLVIATGASTAFYNIPGAAEHSLVLKNLHDAIAIRNRFIMAFEKAVEIRDLVARKKALTFIVAGGGATGVELAAEMTDLFFDTLQKFFCGKIAREEVSIHLIAGDTELLKMFDPKVRERAKHILEKRGVNILFGQRVKAVDERGVTLSDDSRIEAENVLWLAGVMPNVPVVDTQFTKEQRSGRIIVDKTLRVVGQQNMYALGDVATFETEPVPMLAQAAVQQAVVAAQNVAIDVWAMERVATGKTPRNTPLKLFKFHSRGDLISLGQWQAVGHVFHILWEGPIAWFIWRTVYLTKFASWPKRIKIAVDWTIDLFYPRDITKA